MFLPTRITGFLSSSVLVLLIGRVVTVLIAVINLRVMTSFLDPSQYGLWSIFISFQTFATLFLINPVDQHVYMNTHKWSDEGKLKGYLRKYNIYIAIVSLVVSITAFFWFKYSLLDKDANSIKLLFMSIIIGFFVYLGTWNAALTFMLNMLGSRIHSVKWVMITALLGLLFSSAITYKYPYAFSWLIGQTLAFGFGALGAWIYYKKKSLSDEILLDDEVVKFSEFLSFKVVVVFCFPLAAATGFMWVQTTGYRFLIGEYWGMAELGMLAVGLGVSAQLTGIVENLATQLIYPYFVRRVTNSSELEVNSALSDLMNVLAPVYSLWAGFNVICAKTVLMLLTDDRYHSAVSFLIIGALIEYLRSTTNLWTNTARAQLRTKGLIIPYAFGAIVIVLGTFYVLNYKLSLMMFTFVLTFASMVTCLIMIFSMQKLAKLALDKIRISIALIIMIFSFYIATYRLSVPTETFSKFLLIIVVGIIFTFITMLFTWKNHALQRLLNAKLK